MISRATSIAFLLGLLLGVGLMLWTVNHPDLCTRWKAGDVTVPSMQGVEVSGQTVYVPCDQWYPRQTMAMQVLCLVEAAVMVVFVVRGFGDFLRWMRARGSGVDR